MAEEDVPGGRPVGAAAPVATPRSPWVVLFALFGAVLIAIVWANAGPAKPLPTFLVDEAWSIVSLLFIFALPGVLARGNPFPDLRNFGVPLAPLYLVGQVPPVAAMTVGWEGGWILGIAGAAAGAAAGAVAGWLFTLWTLPDIENRHREPVRATRLPIAFAVLFALFGAYSWATAWLTLNEVWVIGLSPIVFALLGAMVRRPFLGLLAALPLVPVQLVPFVASMTVGWEGGWVAGIAGAAAGAAAGATTGWLYSRWLMPEFEKLRARKLAVRPPG